MLRMDISTLRRSELRNLLAAARARGQDSLAEQLEAELAGRRDERPVAAETRTWDVEDEVLPMDIPTDDEFGLDMPIAARPARRRRPSAVTAATVAGIVVLGGGLAWSLSGAPGLPRGEDAPVAEPVAAAPTPRAMVARAAPDAAPPAPVEVPVASPPPAPPTESASPEPAPPEPAPKVVAKAEPVRERPTRLDPCARPPSPADRALCGDLALNLLDHEMREAYGRAMEAGADPIALRDSQSAWRRARDPISDPGALAALYDRRIQELKAAAGPRPE